MNAARLICLTFSLGSSRGVRRPPRRLGVCPDTRIVPSRASFLTPRAALDEGEPEGVPARHFRVEVRDLEGDVVEPFAVLVHVVRIHGRSLERKDPFVHDAAVALPAEASNWPG